MVELKKIIKQYNEACGTHTFALATVVKVRGSSYRSPGARMLIREDGRWFGTISGGCLEGDALRKARSVMQSNEALLVTYDTMDDANNSLQVSLGCNGIIDVLLEPIDSNGLNPLKLLQELILETDLMAMATVFRSDVHPNWVGERLWVTNELSLHCKLTDSQLDEEVREELKRVIQSKQQKTQTFQYGRVEVLFELIEPALNLLIFGGGFDARPVSKLASFLYWDVTVLDECIAHLSPINFPDAHISSCERGKFSDTIEIKPFSAAVLMLSLIHI